MTITRQVTDGRVRWVASEWLHLGIARTRRQALADCLRAKRGFERVLQTAQNIIACQKRFAEALRQAEEEVTGC